ncbi:sensor histidine kinase [Spiractinospora alimapuensis]|uniref:sensor histidine kinase n=1 Tax=Spiractinospora alimapuensis TaxID=2820884 RepID=UPI001F348DEA|nr:histidine kinase [Spiractinospora alimapuensis]
MIGLAVAPLVSVWTYRRWLYLLLGGALFFPFLLAAMVALSMVRFRTVADAPEALTSPVQIAALVIATVLVAATAALRPVAALQTQVARTLLGGRLAREPVARPTGPGARARAMGWLAIHFVVGFVVSLATMVVLTEAGLLAIAPVLSHVETQLTPLPSDHRWLGLPLAFLMLVTFGYVLALVGAGLARLAPPLLGPSAADRLAAAQARAENLTERNRIAAELHDSIGHVLSVVTLQAGTAARVMDSDPEFARQALSTIAEQTRAATEELDHVLGVLREERPSATPQRSLADLPTLVDGARAAGVDLRVEQAGDLDAVPGVVSREAYRVVQEALTNALRYGSGQVDVAVRVGSDGVVVHTTNPVAPRSRTPARTTGGRGLRGIEERVSLLGGTVQAGLEADRWRLWVTIPWKEAG